MTLTRELAARALRPLSTKDAERLRTLTLTNIAASVGALGRAQQLLAAIPLDPDRPGEAAMLHGMRLHARTQDDFHPRGRVHVGAVTLATILAFADRAEDSLLECLFAGYETMCAAASVLSPEAQRRGLRPTGVFGPLGAAAAAAVALGLDEEGIANAIGLAAARSGGTMQAWLDGSDEWLLECGAAARAGVEAALFTIAGVVAAPHALEGKSGWLRAFFGDSDPRELAAAVERQDSYVPEVAVKPHPVSGIAQVATELGRRANTDGGGRNVTSVRIHLSEDEVRYPGSLNRGPFRSRSDALMSVRFCVACSLTDGVVRLARLESPNDLADVVASIDVEADDQVTESEAILTLAIDGETRSYHDTGGELLFPSWTTVESEYAAVAERSEADPGAVYGAVEALRVTRPDAVRVSELIGGISR